MGNQLRPLLLLHPQERRHSLLHLVHVQSLLAYRLTVQVVVLMTTVAFVLAVVKVAPHTGISVKVNFVHAMAALSTVIVMTCALLAWYARVSLRRHAGALLAR